MPLDQDKAFRWRREDAYITVTGAAFAKLAHENGLTVKGPFGGYLYAMLSTTDGQELYRTSGSYWDDIPIIAASTENPAANTQYASITVPAGKRWLLYGVYSTITTDANVANRTLQVYIKADGTNISVVSPTSAAVTASTTAAVRSFSINSPLTATTYSNHLPAIELPAGAVIDIYWNSLQATDDIAAGRYLYKEATA